jgi:phospholipase C
MELSRRKFVSAGAATLAGLTVSQSGVAGSSASIAVGVPELAGGSIQISGSVMLPPPQQSGLEHIVVVTMENRSFDHFLGWLPGADGRQAGLTYVDKTGTGHSTYPLAPDYTGCPHPDPDHSYSGSRVAYDNGAMDGFLRAGSNDIYSIGYYTAPDMPFFSTLAQQYMVCDRYFVSILGPTFPNRMFLWAAQTDRLDDSVSLSSLPTIFDRLAAAGVSHRYFFNNVPFLAFWGLKYIGSTGLFAEFLLRAATGTLPAVSFIDPNYTVLDDGTGNDDHPHADIRNGDAFLARVFHALATGPSWKNTVLIITFDEWGGFFEHVAPPRAVAANDIDTDQVNGQVLLGLRVPTIVASPFTRNAANSPMVNHTVFDHTSALKLIEWRWGLQPLTPRDASPQIGNFATAMNFSSPNVGVPPLPQPGTVAAVPCFQGGIFESSTSRVAPPLSETLAAARKESPYAALARSDGVEKWRREGKLPPVK